MATTHNGVLVPAEMRHATPAMLDAYATRVRAGNRAFVDAYWALADAAAAHGVDVEDLEKPDGGTGAR